ncbi:MAG TPA: UDP-2,4-diacetamido-2,4,6-trideoxy-beta-L-altropyranose hydrolase [Syntrophorhabdus sp.]|jgi:spore coat polysaccharide biosynthesis protein SpsF|nr:UDP-2,4-diacetamido-2,4,6-trideoxy-beta-L-altropyranose hydrolase [Syntrophorhabdus sp.]OPX94454.1 MAG: undecaprenyldiphospho-muramoylpentapeptide beta-N- acetylglucosaminyltransferase [Syntrophorhabdus sp. PtaB.Bin027]OQB77975.1 MAG: undecaprenyldiphospho-muramoylpentapeptide beta-N- acetylglucosaminyltransferase [Deltaproteobacteria bacterium ADurb.Bin135]HNQ45472.1 UDP-2,4-diacetamido-2,4,6-trideoxy-beta-L-altropyranose hydrolase [Syntrophorhabdus sp.]HOD79079.1 UDP-2,4-diacetamido-2,4,6-
MNMKGTILFRCDGSHEIGFGHIVRCIALADELRDKHGSGVVFAVLYDNKAMEMILNHGYKVETANPREDQFDYGDWFNCIVKKNHPCALILDIRDDLPPNIVSNLRKKGILVVTIDDPTDRRLLADLAFYPPVPQVEKMDWQGFTGQRFIGWEWVILRREFSHNDENLYKRIKATKKTKIHNILVTMGGSDPKGMTLKTMEALKVIDGQFEVTIILGPGFAHRDSLNEILGNFPHIHRIFENVLNIGDIMAEADLAVASFGVTAYELAAMGVPAIHLCLTQDHCKSSSVFQKNKIAFCMGQIDEVDVETLAQKVKYLVSHQKLRRNMIKRSQKLFSDNGTPLVAQKIIEEINFGKKEKMANS